MTSKLTREQAEDTIEGLEGLISRGVQSVYLDMAIAGMRQLIATLDSEPVFTLEVGQGEYKGQKLGNQFGFITLDAARKLEEGNYQLYAAQPAPVVPDDVLEALQKVARIRLDLDEFDGDRRGIADCLGDAEEALIEVVNRCAAMLAAAPQEVKGE
ncbi:hypothetical protein [Klebsiella pneumoniae]|uniref:hypothetical protein n=1 Tax=Klebsiella pneumoniae TaxID=573 RepID=UPI000CA10C09|nr:hypothetical protein [Klebsiella pneumoniae]MBZ4697589.1 hypothetical protein [Klebsiella pneumoniae]HDU1609560.1 hypothetical protein [Klebsiella pneumoniae]